MTETAKGASPLPISALREAWEKTTRSAEWSAEPAGWVGLRDLKGTVHLMQVVRDMDEPPRNVHSCFQYGSECPYFSVCTGEAKITDDTRFQERKRRPVPAAPEARRVDEQNPA